MKIHNEEDKMMIAFLRLIKLDTSSQLAAPVEINIFLNFSSSLEIKS